MKLETKIQTRTKFPNIYEKLNSEFKKPIKSEIYNEMDFIEDQLKSEILEDPLIISENAKELFVIPVSLDEDKAKINTKEQVNEKLNRNRKQDLQPRKEYNFFKYANQ